MILLRLGLAFGCSLFWLINTLALIEHLESVTVGNVCLSMLFPGITNDSKDPSVDTFLSTTLPLLKRFGVPSEGLDLKIVRRGSPPHGGGEVVLTIHSVKQLNVSFVFLRKKINILGVFSGSSFIS